MPSAAEPFIPMLRPKVDEKKIHHTVRAILLGEKWESAFVHFFRRQTVPCINQGCLACYNRNEKRQKYWFCGQEPRHGRKVLVEFTPEAWRSLFNQLAKREDKDKGLRGLYVVLDRAGDLPNSRVTCAVQEKRFDNVKLHQEFALREAVFRCFKEGITD